MGLGAWILRFRLGKRGLTGVGLQMFSLVSLLPSSLYIIPAKPFATMSLTGPPKPILVWGSCLVFYGFGDLGLSKGFWNVA